MKVRIVCYEEVNAWILGKFARKLDEELKKLSVESSIANTPDPTADINHHIINLGYNGVKSSCDTTMITHVDTFQKLSLIKKQSNVVEMAVCMSAETMHKLAEAGVPRERLCYINPAHDGVIKPRPLVIGITSKTHRDGRKKQNILLQLIDHINPEEISFSIMGTGWNEIVEKMRAKGFTVKYQSEFVYDDYIKLVPTFDYFLYFSWDEGSMGFIDALAAGVQTIVTPQGYHLDAKDGITYPINDLKDIIDALNDALTTKRRLSSSVSEWTWENYAKKHLQVWEYLLAKRDPKCLSSTNYPCQDGIASVAGSGSEASEVKERQHKAYHSVKLLFSPRTVIFFFLKLSDFIRGGYKK